MTHSQKSTHRHTPATKRTIGGEDEETHYIFFSFPEGCKNQKKKFSRCHKKKLFNFFLFVWFLVFFIFIWFFGFLYFYLSFLFWEIIHVENVNPTEIHKLVYVSDRDICILLRVVHIGDPSVNKLVTIPYHVCG